MIKTQKRFTMNIKRKLDSKKQKEDDVIELKRIAIAKFQNEFIYGKQELQKMNGIIKKQNQLYRSVTMKYR